MCNKICITITLCTLITCFTYAYMNHYSQVIGANGIVYFDHWRQEVAVIDNDGKLYPLEEYKTK